jgi:hypothetical protein
MVILPHDFDAEVGEAAEGMLLADGGDTGEETTSPGFYIYAQAENQYATLELHAGNPGDGDNLLGNDLLSGIEEGLNPYTITVTPQDETSPSKSYFIKVIKLPNLSLSAFKIKKSTNFERDLALVDTQSVFVSYREDLEIVATPADEKATVSKSPSSVSKLSESASVSTDVTVTVSKTLDGVPAEYKTKSYALKLYYTNTDLTPLATGGYISFVPAPSGFYEMHRFLYNGGEAEFLEFTGGTLSTDLKAWVLVVAGGGGGGAGNYPAAGGGAGGLVQHQNYTLASGSYSVTVGAGGAGGVDLGNSQYSQGSNGGDSEVSESISEAGTIFKAVGGGGGANGGGYYTVSGAGKSGGSTGGSYHGTNPTVTPGVFPDGGTSHGNPGCFTPPGSLPTVSPSTTPEDADRANGGGGAGGAGNTRINVRKGGNVGGPGLDLNITGENKTYAAGGDIAPHKTTVNSEDGTGNGGYGSWQTNGGKGGNGIVIIRFLRP